MEFVISNYTKRKIAQAMFHKGKHFVGASVLLNQKDGYPDVVFHLLAQGIEILMKGLILFKDYDGYIGRIGKRNFMGHDLLKVVDEFNKVYGFNPPNRRLKEEIELLNKYYSDHLLRYGSLQDVIGCESYNLECNRVLRRAFALIKYGDKVFGALYDEDEK